MCARCQPGWEGGFGDLDFGLFERLGEPLRHARAVVLNGMGEPLLHPDLPRMVRFVKQRQPEGGWCGLQTNGLPLDGGLARDLAEAGLDVACVSHDGEVDLGHGPGRPGGLGDPLERAAALLRHASRETGRPMRIGVETVLMRGNVGALPALVERAASLGLDFLLASHLLPMDADSEAEALFLPVSAASLALFSRHQADAQAQGLDLGAVPRGAAMFPRSPADQAFLDVFLRMRDEAREQGVWLNVVRLAAVDQGERARLADIFGEARNRAKALGLELRLPPLTAPDRPQDRRCPFMERCAAFIDWRGRVSPCHFLWHGHQCRVLGDRKRVDARHFGDISATPLEELWRDPEFVLFRDTVRRAEYPACGDCGAALCSDVSGVSGPFERDCLGLEVPCGHCPWSVGQLACLGS